MLDIITSLGENYYVECGKGTIIARRCMKQRYVELGFTKTVSSGRAIYINNLVTVGPSKPVLTARVIEQARKRKRQRKTSKQRRISKAKQQMTAMGIVVGGLRADSGAAEEGAEAEKGTDDEGEPEPEITEEQPERLGKLITLYKWRLAQFNMSDAKRGGGAKWRGLSQLMEEHKLHGIALQKQLWRVSCESPESDSEPSRAGTVLAKVAVSSSVSITLTIATSKRAT